MSSSCPASKRRRYHYNHTAYLKRKRTHVYEGIEKRSLRKEARLFQAGDSGKPLLSISGSQIRELVKHVWKKRCIVTGSEQQLVLCRWDIGQPLSPQNHVCLTSALAQKHGYISNPAEYYGSFLWGRVDTILSEHQQHDDNRSNDREGGQSE